MEINIKTALKLVDIELIDYFGYKTIPAEPRPKLPEIRQIDRDITISQYQYSLENNGTGI